MRVIKLSPKHHDGFRTIEGCFAYFNHVLPFNQYYFPISGEGCYLSSRSDHSNTNFIFQYDKKIVAIAKISQVSVDTKDRIDGFYIIQKTLKVFDKNEPIEMEELENILRSINPKSKIVNNQGWNIIDEELESYVFDFLIYKEWGIYREDLSMSSSQLM